MAASEIQAPQPLSPIGEDYFANRHAVYGEIVVFPGLQPQAARDTKAEHKGRYPKKSDDGFRREERECLSLYNQRLYKFLGEDLGCKWS